MILSSPDSRKLRVTIVVGNPKPNSRTGQVATRLVEKLLPANAYETTIIDLIDDAREIFQWPSPRMEQLHKTAADSDLLVLASPTYKATYTGLLKAFLDRYPNRGLNGVVAFGVMTGADLRHAMGPEVHLHPLLVELGAVVPAQSLYFVTGEMDRLDQIIDGWIAENRDRLYAHLPDVLDAFSASTRPIDEKGLWQQKGSTAR